MIVVDASAAVLALLNDGDARAWLANEALAIPHLADYEIVQALPSQVRRGGRFQPDHTYGAVVSSMTGALMGRLQRVSGGSPPGSPGP